MLRRVLSLSQVSRKRVEDFIASSALGLGEQYLTMNAIQAIRRGLLREAAVFEQDRLDKFFAHGRRDFILHGK